MRSCFFCCFCLHHMTCPSIQWVICRTLSVEYFISLYIVVCRLLLFLLMHLLFWCIIWQAMWGLKLIILNLGYFTCRNDFILSWKNLCRFKVFDFVECLRCYGYWEIYFRCRGNEEFEWEFHKLCSGSGVFFFENINKQDNLKLLVSVDLWILRGVQTHF